MFLRKALHARGFRYRLHVKLLPGQPDIVLSKFKAVIFVHGCFWHAHHCPLFKVPKTRTDFWLTKINGNAQRDIITTNKLVAAGWRVATVWECAMKGRHKLPTDLLVARLEDWLTNGRAQTIELQGSWIAGISDH